MLRLWLDDVRPAPEGWTWAKTAREAIALLDEAVIRDIHVEAISLDHDLGADPSQGLFARGSSLETGQDVADYIANIPESVGFNARGLVIRVHSWNPDGANRMARTLRDAGFDVTVEPYRLALSA